MTVKPLRAGLAAAVAALLLAAHAFAYFAWTEDDAGVSFRYAANLASGRGLVYNPGERIEAISNLGYVLVLTPVAALTGKPALLPAAKLLGLLAAILALVPAWRLAAAVGLGRLGGSAVLLLVAGSTPFAAWAVGALETPFVALAAAVLTAAAAALARGDLATGAERAARFHAAAAAAALVLLRIDGFVLALALLGALAAVSRQPRLALRLALPAAILLALTFLFRRLYFHAWWPNPVLAKVELGHSLPATLATLGSYLLPFLRLHGGWLVAGTALGVALVPGRRPATPDSPGEATGAAARARRVAAAAVLAPMAYVLLVGPDWMPLFRFLVPAVVALAVLLVDAARRLGRGIEPRLSPAFRFALVLALVALEGWRGHASFRTRRDSPFWYFAPTLAPRSLLAFWTPATDWLQANLPPDGLLLTSEAGFIPYLTDLRTADSYGLTTRAIATLPRGSVQRSTLGVHTEFTAGPPAGPAERLVAGLPADAIVLQARMAALWNQGQVPEALFDGRFRLAARPGDGSPGAARWAVYLPAAVAPAAGGTPEPPGLTPPAADAGPRSAPR